MQRYASKLGTCLLEASEDGSNPAGRQLVQWVSEATSLMVCMAHGNPRLALKIGLADFTSNHQEQGAELSPRQEPFFVDLLVSLHQHKLAIGCCDPISMDLLILPSQLLH